MKDDKRKKYVETQRVTLAGATRKQETGNGDRLPGQPGLKERNIVPPENDFIDSMPYGKPKANNTAAPARPPVKRAERNEDPALRKRSEINDYDSPRKRDWDDEPVVKNRRNSRRREPAPTGPQVLLLAIIAVLAIVSLYFLVFRSDETIAPAPTEAPTETLAPTPDPTPMPTPEPTPVPTPTPMPTPVTMWGANFPGKFTTGEVITDDSSAAPTISDLSPRFQDAEIEVAGSYKSEHVNVTINKVRENGVTYYVSDIYVTDLKYFTAPFSDGKFSKNGNTGTRYFVDKIAQKNNAIVAINGDFYTENDGPVLRDGVLYRNEEAADMLVMLKDGTMETYAKGEFDKSTIEQLKDSAWQIWTFGPMLIKDGEPMTKFNLPVSNIGGVNPRSAVGYYEPGHYCFVLVEGRSPTGSKGLSMKDLSQLIYDLGCKVAFNLDGGGSAQLAFMGDEVNNKHISTYRKDRDALCIIDEPAPEETATPDESSAPTESN